MVKIAYTGLHEPSLKVFQENLYISESIFIEVSEENLKINFSDSHDLKDVLIVGEEAGNPIKITQTAHALDNYLSIVIINDANSYQKIKQALLFTPFIGNTVHCVSNTLGKGLISVIQDAIARTQQRRNYAKFKLGPGIAFPTAHIYESVRSEYLDKFLDEAPIGAVLMSREGVILALNRYAIKILQKSEKVALGISLATLLEGNIHKALSSFISEGFYHNPIQTFERKLHDKLQYLEIRIAEISAKSQTKYKIGILNDITNHVLAQQKVESQLKELALTNENLKKVNADLDTFVYTASHDLKAPIANIEGLVELLEKRIKAYESKSDHIFDMIKLSIGRFKDTVRDLTEVAHLQKNSPKEIDLVDVGEIIEEAQSLIREMIISTEAQIEVDYHNCKKIKFSVSNFRSIIYNLLSNAIKYRSPDRKPVIQITVERINEYTLLTVKDNGLGIASDKIEKIFSMFQRFHMHTEGTGIGLYIVKRIIDNTGGKIEVESELGMGSTFKVYFKGA